MIAASQLSSWREFAAAVASCSELPEDAIVREARLLADLDLDSLALAELIVSLTERYAPASLMQELEDRDWNQITVGQLYEECIADHGLES